MSDAAIEVPTGGSRRSLGLGEGANRRGLIALLIDTFLMWGGFFMVVPLLSVYYVDRLGWAAASIGTVLALRQLAQQGLTPISGMLADRLGAKWLICAGLLLRTVGFAWMAFADTFPVLLLSALLAAIGGSLFESPKSAAIAALTTPTNRSRFYSLTGMVSGLGVTLGTQAGAFLLRFDFTYVALAAAACYVVTFLVTAIMLPPVRVASEQGGLTSGIRMALRDRPFMVFNLLLMGFWFMWVQMSISMPLIATDIAGTFDAVGWVYALNSGMTILLQYPLLRLAERWLRPKSILLLGVVLMASGMASIVLVGNLTAPLLSVALISTSALLAMPSQQTVTAELSNPAALGSYFGVNASALAIGGGLGNFSGGLLYDVGKQSDLPALPWIVFGAVGLLTALGLRLLVATGPRLRARAAATVSH